jgi:hypothetical protein
MKSGAGGSLTSLLFYFFLPLDYQILNGQPQKGKYLVLVIELENQSCRQLKVYYRYAKID